MIEKFADRRFFGNITVVCKNDDGTSRTWKADKAQVAKQIVAIVQEFQDIGQRLTLRQLHYQFVSHVENYINHTTAYKKLGVILDDCRYGGLVDWDAIEDRGRNVRLPYYVSNIPDALNDTYYQYRLNRQLGQSSHIEVWTEKEALSAIFSQPANKYHVRLVVNKGYTSSSAIYGAYQRFADVIRNGQRVIVLYFGDHDPSGLDMVRDIRERMEFFFANGENKDLDPDFEIISMGLNQQQIKKYKLPPNPTKLTDTRSPKYIKKFGRTCWEVDALRPDVLAAIVEQNILFHMDIEQYAGMLDQEENDKQKLLKFIKNNSK